MILADENIDYKVVEALRNATIFTESVFENYRGYSDAQIVQLSKNPKRIILTEDKDFGEWVYSHKETEISVILLRYSFSERNEIIEILLDLILSKGEELFGKFTIVTANKVRIRTI
jgi:predicted nuclease of predicted toxin-antitoxin system